MSEKQGQPPAYPAQGYQQQPAYPTQGQATGGFSAQTPPPYGATTTTVLYQQPTIIKVGNVPVNMICPHCQDNIITNVEYRVGLMVWLIVGILFLVGLGLGCCLIPLCIKSLKDVVHFCPNCNREIGRFDRLNSY